MPRFGNSPQYSVPPAAGARTLLRFSKVYVGAES
jgi:hypothetical protein